MKKKPKRNSFYQLQYLRIIFFCALDITTVCVFQKRSNLLILPRIEKSNILVNPYQTLTACEEVLVQPLMFITYFALLS